LSQTNPRNLSSNDLEGKEIVLLPPQNLTLDSDYLAEKIVMQIPDEVLGGPSLNDDDEEGDSSNAKDNSIIFPIHEYTSEGTFVKTDHIDVPEREEKKTGFFGKKSKKQKE
jgi:hypothetical protein